MGNSGEMTIREPLKGSPDFRAALVGALVGAVAVGAVWGLRSAALPKGGTAGTSALASVHGRVITHAALAQTLMTQYGRQTLQQMIQNQLIADAAKGQKIHVTAADMQKVELAIESQYGITNSAELTSFLQANGMTNPQFQAILKNQALEQKLAESGIQVTNKEIAAYYKANRSSFIPTGSKTPLPLSQVKGQVVSAIMASKALSPTQLFQNLAGTYKITVYDRAFKSVQTAIQGAPKSSSVHG